MMGAVVLFSGGTQASDREVSELWAGEWTCSSRVTYHPSPTETRIGKTGLKHMIIGTDGSVTVNSYSVAFGQFGAMFTDSIITGTATEGPNPFLLVDFVGPSYTATAIFIGSSKHPDVGFEKMRYVEIGVDDPPLSFQHGRVEGECERTTALNQ